MHSGDHSNVHVLVTGAAGFIGARLVRLLVGRGFPVRAVDVIERPERIADLLDHVSYVRADVAGSEPPDRLVEGVTHVVHLAAFGIAWNPQDSFGQLLNANVLGTHELILAAGRAGVRKVVCAGSVFEYGYRLNRAADRPIGRDAPCGPLNVYGVTKAASTLLTPLIGDAAGVKTTVLRVFSPYGPGEDERRFVPSCVVQAENSGQIRMTSGEQERDFCYVDDIALAFLTEALISRNDHATFNLGTGRALKLRDAARIISRRVDPNARLDLGAIPYRFGEAMRLVADTTDLDLPLRQCLQTTFETGVDRYLAWRARQ